MLALLRRRPAFARLWLAGVVSLIGDWLTFVAVSLLAVERGGGAVDLALMLVAHSVPGALISPLAGAFADRFDRRRMLVLTALAQAMLTFAMVAAALRGAVFAVQILVFARSATAGFVAPTEAAALPRVVERDELLPANALVASTWSFAFVCGMALGGLLAMVGAPLAIALDALSFVIAAGLLATLPAMPSEGRAVDMRVAIRAVPRDVVEAWKVARESGPLLRAVLRKGTLAIAGGAGWLALNLVATVAHPFGSAALTLGVLQALRGAGTGFGPALASWVVSRGGRPETAADVADTVALASIAVFVTTTNAALLALVAFAWGLGSGSNWVLSSVETQRRAPAGMLGRLTSLDELFATFAMSSTACIAAALVDSKRISLASAVWLGAALATAAFCVLRATGPSTARDSQGPLGWLRRRTRAIRRAS